MYLNVGDGTFAPRADYLTAGSTWFSLVVIGDADGDGNADLATLANGVVSLLLGNGDGTFAPRTEYAITDDGRSLAFGDLNGDGILM